MAQSTPETNMAILANAGEIVCNTVASMMGNETVKNLFTRPDARENVYRGVMLAVHKKLEGRIRDMPTGQFNKSVLQGEHQSRGVYPNVSA